MAALVLFSHCSSVCSVNSLCVIPSSALVKRVFSQSEVGLENCYEALTSSARMSNTFLKRIRHYANKEDTIANADTTGQNLIAVTFIII